VHLGVGLGGSGALADNLRVTASANNTNAGMTLYSDEATVVRNADATALGGSITMGISFGSVAMKTLELTNVTARARNGFSNCGLLMGDGGPWVRVPGAESP
jgi:hypothetical protein